MIKLAIEKMKANSHLKMYSEKSVSVPSQCVHWSIIGNFFHMFFVYLPTWLDLVAIVITRATAQRIVFEAYLTIYLPQQLMI